MPVLTSDYLERIRLVNRRKIAEYLSSLSLTYSGFLLFSPISILAVPVSLLVVNPQYSPWQLVLWGILLTVATFAVYAFLKKTFTLLRIRNALRNSLLFVVLIVMTGSLRGLLFFGLVEYLDLQQPSTLGLRILDSTLTTLFWLSLSNIVIVFTVSFKRKYQSTLNQILHTQINGSIEPHSQGGQDLTKLQQSLVKSVDKYIDSLDPNTARELSKALINQINNEIRPLSQRIWIADLRQYPVINYRLLITDALRHLNYSTSVFLVIYGTLALIENLFLRGLNESLIRTFSALLVSICVIKIFENVEHQTLTKNILYLLSVGLVPVLASESLVNKLGYNSIWSATLLITPVASALVIVLSILRLNFSDRNLMLDTLNNHTNSVLPLSSNKNLASYLHNSLQAELLALSAQLEEVAVNSDPEKLIEVVEKLTSLTNRSMIDDFAKFNESPLKRLDSFISAWAGIIEITVDYEEIRLVDSTKVAIIVQVIEEIVTNSFRRGSASRIHISIGETTQGMRLCFVTNGVQIKNENSGLGSTLLNEIAVTPIGISQSDSGVIIEVVI